ncbi:MAG: ABC-F family ATP-binding cassette domain-containing protein [Rikenellaceae bacterium]|jgi:ATP-binding cassette subfamily F protein uup|nr:ABC-F family ATP-binding cassette domain-containing protein [Rikenellaceae bacterium]
MSTPIIQLENITKSFGERVLYEGLSLTLTDDQRAALIAPNGAGKTTLLRLIAGIESPDSGTVTFQNDLRVGFLEQEPALPEQATVLEALYQTGSEAGETVKAYEQALLKNDRARLEELLPQMDRLSAWDYESRARAILTKLRITDLEQPVSTLSGGQRKRVALAAILIDDPQVLILDEPTNHLDLDMVEWLEEFLLKRKKPLLLVTHDRYFLDRICNVIYELDQKKLYSYTGGYTEYLIKREERIARFHAEVDRAQNLYRTELEWMRRMPQARGTKAKYRKDAFLETRERAFQKRDEGNVRIPIKAQRLGTKIFEVEHLFKSYGERVILRDFSYTFARYEKMGIIGENGTGKTTFLNLIAGLVPPDSGTIDIGESVRLGYYRQQGIAFDEGEKVIDIARRIAEVVTLGDGSTISVSSFLNQFLFPPARQQDFVAKLSGGERRRLYLLTILMRSPNFLMLDEPTNDLDIMTLNVLEEYLQNFAGCIIIVSHDRYFMDKVAEHLLVFEGAGAIRDFPGNYTQYRNEVLEREEAAASKTTAQAAKTTPAPRTPRADNRAERPRKMSFRERQEFEQLGREIEALEEEKRTLESTLAGGSLKNDEILAASTRIGVVLEELDEKEMRWLELSELL